MRAGAELKARAFGADPSQGQELLQPSNVMAPSRGIRHYGRVLYSGDCARVFPSFREWRLAADRLPGPAGRAGRLPRRNTVGLQRIRRPRDSQTHSRNVTGRVLLSVRHIHRTQHAIPNSCAMVIECANKSRVVTKPTMTRLSCESLERETARALVYPARSRALDASQGVEPQRPHRHSFEPWHPQAACDVFHRSIWHARYMAHPVAPVSAS